MSYGTPRPFNTCGCGGRYPETVAAGKPLVDEFGNDQVSSTGTGGGNGECAASSVPTITNGAGCSRVSRDRWFVCGVTPWSPGHSVITRSLEDTSFVWTQPGA
jgi:hypothetical protein